MGKSYSLERIRSFIGNNETALLELAILFVKLAPENLESLKEGLDKKDYDTVGFYAHKLKSSIDSFEIKELMTDIRTIENNAKKRSSVEDLPVLVSKLETVVHTVIREIKKDFKL